MADPITAETPHKVARWDGESHWELSPAHTLSNMTVVTACDRAQAIAWGYTIEGDPDPIDDTAPERLRERRAAAREVCHVKRRALTEATTARAIVDAQQGGAS